MEVGGEGWEEVCERKEGRSIVGLRTRERESARGGREGREEERERKTQRTDQLLPKLQSNS